MDGRKHRRNGFSLSRHRGEKDGMWSLAVGGALCTLKFKCIDLDDM